MKFPGRLPLTALGVTTGIDAARLQRVSAYSDRLEHRPRSWRAAGRRRVPVWRGARHRHDTHCFVTVISHWQRQRRLEARGWFHSVARIGHDPKSCAIWCCDSLVGEFYCLGPLRPQALPALGSTLTIDCGGASELSHSPRLLLRQGNWEACRPATTESRRLGPIIHVPNGCLPAATFPRSSGSLELRLTRSAHEVRKRPFPKRNSEARHVQPREQAALPLPTGALARAVTPTHCE